MFNIEILSIFIVILILFYIVVIGELWFKLFYFHLVTFGKADDIPSPLLSRTRSRLLRLRP